MEDDTAVRENHESVVNSKRTGLTSGNEIVELDVNLEPIETPIGNYKPPKVTDEELSLLADALADCGADEQSARIEIERRHYVSNEDHVFRFTAAELTDIVIATAVVKLVATYYQNHDLLSAIKSFGRLIKDSHDTPMDARNSELELPHLAPLEEDYVDPFRVISGRQTLVFVDENGEQLSAEDISVDDLDLKYFDLA